MQKHLNKKNTYKRVENTYLKAISRKKENELERSWSKVEKKSPDFLSTAEAIIY